MSVEIEVGLENAARANPRLEEMQFEKEPPKGLANPKVQRLLIFGGAAVVVLLAGLFLY